MIKIDMVNHCSLSSPQIGIWFDQIRHANRPLYNIGGYVRIAGPVNFERFKKAINQVILENDALRTIFYEGTPLPVQTFAKNIDVQLDFQDFSAPEAPHQQALQWMGNQFTTPFQLYGHFLFQFALLKIAEDCYYGFAKYHHLIIDGWGIALVFQRIEQQYQALEVAQLTTKPAVFSYANFVQDDQQYFKSDIYQRHEQYWQQKYRELPEPLIPFRYANQFTGIAPSHRQILTIKWDFYARLKTFAKDNKASTFHAILAILYCYFIRTTGNEDFVIGLPVLNRSSATFKQTVGLFTGIRPARFSFGTEFNFIELMQAINKELRKDYRCQRFPLQEINKLAGIHQAGRLQLFDITLSYQKHDYLTHFAGHPAKVLTLPNGFEQSALAIAVEEYQDNQDIRLTFDYNLAAYDDAEMERIIARFESLLAEVMERPTVPIWELNLMPAKERHQVLVEFNDTAASYPQDKTIVDLFEEQVEKTPDNIAVVFPSLRQAQGTATGSGQDEEQQLTYQELNRRANQLAHYLQTLGVGPEVLVGLCVERSLEMLIGLLGILKVGGAYVPLDPNYPSERLALMLEDSQAPVLLTQSQLKIQGLKLQTQVVYLDSNQEIFSNAQIINPVNGVQPGNLAYVIYTSGSTGKPKGVAISHQAVMNFLTAMHQTPGLTAQDIMLAVTTISFDIAVLELYLPLMVGAKITLVSRETAADGHKLLAQLETSKATIMQATPATWRMLLAAGWENSPNLTILVGGEALPRKLAQQLLANGSKVWNLYGPTETTVWSAIYPVTNALLRGLTNDAQEPIGHPIANTQIYILDQQLKMVPIGVPGELHIGGAGLARGYYNRLELTTEKFIADPFSTAPQDRLYKTGDLARYLPDGHIEYLGRIDHQVKIRGFRIELGEIESILAQHPLVHETAVIIHEEVDATKRLVAYFSTHQDSSPISNELRDFLKQKLPSYMIPAFFIARETLPLTPNGKINRQALSQLSIVDYPLSEDTFVAPRTPEEELLVNIWADILGLEQVGTHDNFFELGGDSILATQIISRIRDNFAGELSLRDLFELPTISALADKIQANRINQPQLPPIQVIERSDKRPLSFAQQRLWFIDQLLEDEHRVAYNMAGAIRLLGPLNMTAFEQSLTEIVQRHETLRTTFPKGEDSSPVNQLSIINYQLSKIDLWHLPTEEQTTEVQRLAREKAQRPFDLAKGPLFRTTLLQLGTNENVLLITMHHIISDGWSIGVFVHEFTKLYEAFTQGKPSPLAPLSIQYADFVHWQQQWLTGEVLETQVNYWQQQLAGIPSRLELPTDRPRPTRQTFQGKVQHFEINHELTKRLKKLSAQHEATLFITLLTAFVTLLHRYSGQDDIVVGSPIANRNHHDIESLIGLFVNTLVLRTQVADNPSFTDLLHQVRQVCLDAYAHQEVPFEQLVEVLKPERNLSHSPLFQIMFVLQNAPQAQLELPGLNVQTLEMETVSAKFDLTLFMEETAQGLKAGFEYNTDLFNPDTIMRMVGHLQTLLAGIVANPTQSVAELPLLTQAEQHQLLVKFNDTAMDYPQDKCVHQLFENQVEKTPNAIAVVFEEQPFESTQGKQLTYQALNERANQVAHYLQTLGVGPEVLVGICVERSVEMIIGLLGILKAGGAYVPLDPNYPQERLAFMLADSNVSVLLTQQKLIAQLPSHQAQIVCLDTDKEVLSKASSANLVTDVQPDNLAYVMYTSGSTGKPKGVSVIHKNIVRLVIAPNYLDLTPNEVFLQLAPLSFDASTLEIWAPLLHGAKLVIMPPHPPSLEELGKAIQHYQVTILWLTAGLFHLMVEERLEDLKPVRRLLAGGEALSVPHIQKALRVLETTQLINGYGPTENTTFTCCFPMTASTILKSNVPIGRPITNTQVYILDRYLNPTPIGVPGELYTGGDGIARCYFNRPDLSGEKLIPHPFSDKPNARLYKTGDLARYLPDGNIEFLGRIDHQVKLRGFRIELGEIETLLNQHPNVQEAVVIIREEQPGDKCLVTYFVSEMVPKRIPYETKCCVEFAGQTWNLRTEDISEKGVCLQHDEAMILKKDHKIRLHLQLPNESEKRWLQGKVVWSRDSWAGVKFVLTSEEQTILARNVEYLIEKSGILKIIQRLLVGNLRHSLEAKLPAYMVPSHFVLLQALPLTPNGKVDRQAINRRVLPMPKSNSDSLLLKKEFLPQTELETLIAEVWQEVLQIKKVGIYDHFFEIGGHSLLIAQVQAKLQDRLGFEMPMVELFEHPTIHALAQHLTDKQGILLATQQTQSPTKKHQRTRTHQATGEIAIIGMTGRFPGANNIEEFWQNLRNGVESIAFFDDSEVLSAGIDMTRLNQPNYVKAGGVISDIEQFDATFFDMSPKEAQMMDPQQRLFLECAWEALETAGIEPGTAEYDIGVYAGVGANTYLLNNLYLNYQSSDAVDNYQLMIGNGHDFLPTHVSYKLNLKGPSVNVQTACSTSLVAVHSACQSLLNNECDIVLAGGISIRVPHKAGYLYQEGMIYSPDGHCRAFDAKAQGTVVSDGVGVVVLKRLENAIADGDSIQAVIKGSAINNDGSAKVGYTAPSIKGQSEVIVEALDHAGIEPETIRYIETHGTGTQLGDPIEIAALNKAFQERAPKLEKGNCAIGSVKTNIGHTDTAAGVTGLIKTVLALKHQLLPPSLHFEHANPQIDFANSPFYVNTTLSKWPEIKGTPRRAGVSSFGIGGTNAHLILEEAPTVENSGESRPWQLLVLSAKTDSALETATANLATYLEQHPEVNLADVAYTLSKGRKRFSHRRMLICQTNEEAVLALRTVDSNKMVTNWQELEERPIVFMFPGQGTQYVNMGLELYQNEPIFRAEIDRCAEYLKPHLELDLRQILYPNEAEIAEAQQKLEQTAIIQPALFVINYALAKLWMAWGVYPEAMIGHSIGEYVAACISGVFSLEDALSLVTARGQLMQQLPEGAMLAVSLSESEVQVWLDEELSIAAINTPAMCTISGTIEAVEQLESQLSQQGVSCHRLHTFRAFHSHQMEPIMASFTDMVKKVRLYPPQIPYLSNVTGTWITAEQTFDHSYWARHLRQTVRFADGLQQILKKPERILLEVGPGRVLSTIAKQHADKKAKQVVLSSLRHPKDQMSDEVFLLNSLGKLWLNGGQNNWSRFYADERRHRVPLPTYPFERQRYWIEPSKSESKKSQPKPEFQTKKLELTDWFYRPVWKESVPPTLELNNVSSLWLVFVDTFGVGSQLVNQLELAEQEVIIVHQASEFRELDEHNYTINPQSVDDYNALVEQLRIRHQIPQQIVHLWNISAIEQLDAIDRIEPTQVLGYYSLLFLAQALGKQNVTDQIAIAVISSNMQAVTTDEEELSPEKATLLGPVKVIGQEYPNLTCRSIDVLMPASTKVKKRLFEQLLAELTATVTESVIAYRGQRRWVQTFEPVKLPQIDKKAPRLKEGGVYLITGGLGGIGLTLAEHLAKTVRAKLVLIGRSTFPAKNAWSEWLATHSEQESISQKIRKLQSIEQQGVEFLIIRADVANIQQMQAVLTATEQQFGTINGVIHAAGVPDGALIPRQTRKIAETVLAPKMKGTLVLDKLLQDVQLDFLILCSSLASILGIGGQIAYCAANAFMDSFAQFKMVEGNHPTFTINWDSWQEVGMAVKGTKKLSAFQSPESDLLDTLDISKLENQPVNHPLFDYHVINGSGPAIYVTYFSLLKHWILREHQTMGNGLIPGTAYLEMAKFAFENHTKQSGVEIRNVYFLMPLMVTEGEEKEVRTLLQNRSEYFDFLIMSRTNSGDESWQTHVRGEITGLKVERYEKQDIQAIEAGCNEQKIVLTKADHEGQSKHFIYFGPRWQSLQQILFGKQQALALLELPESCIADLSLYQLHPALLDSATGYANIDYFCPLGKKLPSGLTESLPSFLSLKEEGVYYLPFSYKRLQIKGPLPSKIYSHLWYEEGNVRSKEALKFNLTIMDTQGTVLLEIEEYMLRKVELENLSVQNSHVQATSSPDIEKMVRSSNTTETTSMEAWQQDLKEGLLPTDGIEVFNRILGSTLPQILVSTRDLPSRFDGILNSLKNDKPKPANSVHPRPQLSETYVAPRNEIERKMADFWQQFLGVEKVGIHDNFFELGGDSLLAIQLMANLRDTFQLELSPNSLFNAATIATLVEIIEETTLQKTDSSKSRQSLPSILVEIQKGNRQQTPLFLMPPLSGLVYFYSELASGLGSEQPVYALQSQGLDGHLAPVTQVEVMATQYIEAIRVLQPEGPYLLGGSSFGGMVAFEMARQLQKLGQNVALLAMMDTPGPGQMPNMRLENHAQILAYLLKFVANISVSAEEFQHLDDDEQLHYAFELAKAANVKLPLEKKQIRYFGQVLKANSQAMWNYKPQMYFGRIHFFRAIEWDGVTSKHQELAWVNLANEGLDIHEIPGNHITMNFPPHIQVIAKQLKPYLINENG